MLLFPVVGARPEGGVGWWLVCSAVDGDVAGIGLVSWLGRAARVRAGGARGRRGQEGRGCGRNCVAAGARLRPCVELFPAKGLPGVGCSACPAAVVVAVCKLTRD